VKNYIMVYNLITQEATKAGANLVSNQLDDSEESSNNTEVFNPIIGGDDGVVGTEDDPDLSNDATERVENNEDVEAYNPLIGGDDGVVGTEDDPDFTDEETDSSDDSGSSIDLGNLFGGNSSSNDSNDSEGNQDTQERKTLTIDYPREYTAGGSSMFGLGVVGQPINYTVQVSGEIKAGSKANTGILGNDNIDGNTASGKISIGSTDSYEFTGSLEDISGSGNIKNLTILVDGKEYSADTSTGDLVEGDTTNPGSLKSQLMLAGVVVGGVVLYGAVN